MPFGGRSEQSFLRHGSDVSNVPVSLAVLMDMQLGDLPALRQCIGNGVLHE
jgi:hypothetical protein